MLVTLKEEDWPTEQLKLVCRRGQRYHETKLAAHNPIAHMLGQPCIILRGFSNDQKKRIRRYYNHTHVYPLVHERNILKILSHESVHCAIQVVDENAERWHLSLDNLLPHIGELEAG